jgi:hypothetical protein
MVQKFTRKLRFEWPPTARISSGLPSQQSGHWLALAAMASFFTRKSHAAVIGACNFMIQRSCRLHSDIFDSHRPLHSPEQSHQRAEVSLILSGPLPTIPAMN